MLFYKPFLLMRKMSKKTGVRPCVVHPFFVFSSSVDPIQFIKSPTVD